MMDNMSEFGWLVGWLVGGKVNVDAVLWLRE